MLSKCDNTFEILINGRFETNDFLKSHHIIINEEMSFMRQHKMTEKESQQKWMMTKLTSNPFFGGER